MSSNLQDIPSSSARSADSCQAKIPLSSSLESIARGEMNAAQTRIEIDLHIKATGDFTKPYSVLMLWAWQALMERRTDDDLRHWHRLILDIAARARNKVDSGANTPGSALAERFRAISDMLRVSIDMQSCLDKEDLATRADVSTILQAMKDQEHERITRADLLKSVTSKPATLSQILALLVLKGLAERLHQVDGSAPRYRILDEGIRCLDSIPKQAEKQSEQKVQQ